LVDFLSDRKILLGIGIGIIIGTIVMSGVKYNVKMTAAQIEEKARAMGMDYPDNFKVIYDKEVGK
jgi:hypothetical protein